MRRFPFLGGYIAGFAGGVLIAGAIVLRLTSASAAPAATTSSVNITPPAYCTKHQAALPTAIRAYAYDMQGDQFLRSGADGHGGMLRCLFVDVGNTSGLVYGKWIEFNPPLPIGPNGVDVTYYNCAVPPLRFPYPNPGPNDCAESWSPVEPGEGGNPPWTFAPGQPNAGTGMIPASSP